MRPKILIVLGAGASHGYGPSTAWLTARLLGQKNQAGAFFRRLKTRLRRARASKWAAPYEANFEELVHAGDELAGDRGSSALSRRPGRGKLSEATLERYSEYTRQARRQILRWTRRHAAAALAKSPGPPIVAEGLGRLGECAHVRILSLNYDDLPVHSGLDFYTGFVEGEGSLQTFRPDYPWPQDRHLWCQMHGSVLFGLSLVEQTGEYEIVRSDNASLAAQRKWPRRAMMSNQDGSWSVQAPMVTGLRKSDALQGEPFNTYAHLLREEALTCDRWLILGFSGGDHHVRRVLSQCRDHWRRSGRPHRVLVVDYYPLGDNHIPMGSLLYDPDPDWAGGGSVWLIEREDVRSMRSVRARTITRATDTLAVSLDGGDYIFGDGLEDMMEFFDLH